MTLEDSILNDFKTVYYENIDIISTNFHTGFLAYFMAVNQDFFVEKDGMKYKVQSFTPYNINKFKTFRDFINEFESIDNSNIALTKMKNFFLVNCAKINEFINSLKKVHNLSDNKWNVIHNNFIQSSEKMVFAHFDELMDQEISSIVNISDLPFKYTRDHWDDFDSMIHLLDAYHKGNLHVTINRTDSPEIGSFNKENWKDLKIYLTMIKGSFKPERPDNFIVMTIREFSPLKSDDIPMQRIASCVINASKKHLVSKEDLRKSYMYDSNNQLLPLNPNQTYLEWNDFIKKIFPSNLIH